MNNTNNAAQLAFWTVVEVDTQGGAYTDSTGVWNVAYPTADAAKRAVEAECTERNDEDCEDGETNGAIEFEWTEDGDGRWIGWNDDLLTYVFVTRTVLA